MSAHPVLVIARHSFLEAWRTRLFWLLLVAVLGSLALAEFVGAVAITESLETRAALLATLLRMLAVMTVSLFVTTSMLRELSDKGVELVLSLPVTRASYFLGRLAGYAGFALASALIFGLAVLFYAPLDQGLFWTLSLCCELLIIAALSLLCVFTLNQVTLAFVTVMGFYVLSRAIGAMQLMEQGPLVDPNSLIQQILNGLVDAVAFILPELYRFTRSDWLVYHGADWASLLPILGQTLIYVLLLAGAGLFDLYRRNF